MAKSKFTKVKVGDFYNKIEVLSLYRNEDTGKTDAWCKCICGKEKAIRATLLTRGLVYSCGCSKAEGISKKTKKHGFTSHILWPIYSSMVNRCTSLRDKNFDSYGGRGITVCDRWLESNGQGFLNFLEDMGECPEGLSLDRIDVNGNYCKENCRWATGSEQMYNQRKRKTNTSGRTGVSFYTKRGKWSAEICIDNAKIRLGLFVSFEDAVKAREEAEILYYGELKPEVFNDK